MSPPPRAAFLPAQPPACQDALYPERGPSNSIHLSFNCVIRFRFEGPQTSGKNHQGRTREGRVYPTKHFVAWRDVFGAQFLMQKQPWNRYFPLQEPVVIWITYVPGDGRIRDVPGMEDALWHLFEWVGFVKNDTLLRGVVWRMSPVDRAALLWRLRFSRRIGRGSVSGCPLFRYGPWTETVSPVIPDKRGLLNRGASLCTGSVRGVSWGYVC